MKRTDRRFAAPPPQDKLRVNERIRSREIRVINDEGVQIGVMAPEEALRIAKEEDLDLVEVAPESNPPVCRIMDYGKFKYELKRKEHKSKSKSAHHMIKEIRLRPRTEQNDFDVKLKHAREFMAKGHKVQVTCIYRGRELAHKELGQAQLNKFAEAMKDIGKIEQEPRLEGRRMNILIAAK